MKKKFICTVCGYIHEGDHAPEKCPMCGVPASKFKELKEESGLSFVSEHEIGVAKGCDEEMIKDLNNHFMGECTEVGMYLAMSRQADWLQTREWRRCRKTVLEYFLTRIIRLRRNMLKRA